MTYFGTLLFNKIIFTSIKIIIRLTMIMTRTNSFAIQNGEYLLIMKYNNYYLKFIAYLTKRRIDVRKK